MEIPKILNGDVLESRTEYSWYCNILHPSDIFNGGGVYLGGQFILTAASNLLITSDANSLAFRLPMMSASEVTVRMGHLRQSDVSIYPRDYTVDQIFIHSDFGYCIAEQRDNSDDFQNLMVVYQNDLAILKLNSVPFADSFQPATILPTDMQSDVIIPGNEILCLGTGLRNLTLSDTEIFQISHTVTDVPVEIGNPTVIYTTDSNAVRTVTLTIMSDVLWRSRIKTHALVVKDRDLGLSDGQGVFYIDYSKNTNLDSSDIIASDIHNYLTTDWCIDWQSLLQSPPYNLSASAATSDVANTRDNISHVTLSSDLELDLKFFAGDFGDQSDIQDVKSMAVGDEGGPAVYTGADGKMYLIGLFNRAIPDYLGDFPNLFTNVLDYLDWITATTQPLVLSDAVEVDLALIQSDIAELVSDSVLWTTDTVELWQQDVLLAQTDVNLFLIELANWSSDLQALQPIILLLQSDGSSDYALVSDLIVSQISFGSDAVLISNDLISFVSDFSDSSVNPSDIPVMTSDMLLFQNDVTGLQSDMQLMTESFATFNRQAVTHNLASSPDVWRDAFYRLRVSNPVSLFTAESAFDPWQNESSTMKFVSQLIGETAEATFSSEGYYSLIVETESDCVIRQSRHYIPDQAGLSKIALISGVLLTGPQSQETVVSRFGLFDGNNGHCLQLATDGLSFCELVNGVETVIPQSNWNIDPLDGTGSSGLNLSSYIVANGNLPDVVDLSYHQNILIIDTEWTGLTRLGFFLNGVPRYAHQFAHENRQSPISNSSGLPVRYQIKKISTDNTQCELRVCWCNVLVEGTYVPHVPRFSYSNARGSYSLITPSSAAADSALTPVFSMRIKDIYSHASVKVETLKLSITTNNDIYWELIKNVTLQSDTWLVNAPYGSMIEFDTTTARYSRGIVIKDGFLNASSMGETNFVDSTSSYLSDPILGIDLNGDRDTLTLGIRNLRGGETIKLWYIIGWMELGGGN